MALSVCARPGPSCQANPRSMDYGKYFPSLEMNISVAKGPSVCVIIKLGCMRDLAPGAVTVVAASSGRPSRIRVWTLAIDRCTGQLTGKGEARKTRIRHITTEGRKRARSVLMVTEIETLVWHGLISKPNENNMNLRIIPISTVSHPSRFGPLDSQSSGVHESAAGRRLAPNPLPRGSNEQSSMAVGTTPPADRAETGSDLGPVDRQLGGDCEDAREDFHPTLGSPQGPIPVTPPILGSTLWAPPTLTGKALFRVRLQRSQRGHHHYDLSTVSVESRDWADPPTWNRHSGRGQLDRGRQLPGTLRDNQTKHYQGTHDGTANRPPTTAAARIKPPPRGRGAKERDRRAAHVGPPQTASQTSSLLFLSINSILYLHTPFSQIQLPASCLADPQKPSRYVQTLFCISPAPEPLYHPPQAPGLPIRAVLACEPNSVTTVHDECLVLSTHLTRWMEVIIAGSLPTQRLESAL
ncbi:uncharacterized protein BO96DRAFT_431102 [Aspergillus niger CBS 101883]|uniref:Contig An13c0080, genomic contig n=3 Tax=Aspergillus niger TaxID=5061 RepID=A2R1W3_ASPNC|nr:uncharacterized protein BO96DRAFT_431102 [Aspergillus niger CBS 101883]XP_059602130.1 uncharacterized protein An13g02660 [Aspergillus niger]PYH60009.1 hypothetical protein BO96DRAFT_431102 [Aspergillus niger CBS 101883]RDH24343.1 hypothetical protein M747DRAFT_229831 [Aspergillus niger ATCC 13496]CAK41663.1 unnamed protein product [Aspergillus niger]